MILGQKARKALNILAFHFVWVLKLSINENDYPFCDVFSSSGRGEVDEVELAEAASIPDPPNQPKATQFFLLPPARNFRNDNWKRACETIEVTPLEKMGQSKKNCTEMP